MSDGSFKVIREVLLRTGSQLQRRGQGKKGEGLKRHWSWALWVTAQLLDIELLEPGQAVPPEMLSFRTAMESLSRDIEQELKGLNLGHGIQVTSAGKRDERFPELMTIFLTPKYTGSNELLMYDALAGTLTFHVPFGEPQRWDKLPKKEKTVEVDGVVEALRAIEKLCREATERAAK